MRSHGYDSTTPVTLYKGTILDGASRQDAADKIGISPTYTTFEGTEDEAMLFVLRRNKARKHMTTYELDLAAERLATMKHGGDRSKFGRDQTCSLAKTRKMIAKEIGRSPATLSDARTVNRRGTPNLIAMVEAGEVSCSVAADAITLKADVANMTAAEVREAVQDSKRKMPYYAKAKDPKPSKEPKLSKLEAWMQRPRLNLTQLDIGEERIPMQPVQLQPARVQLATEAIIRATTIANFIKRLAETDMAAFLADLALARGFQVVPGKKNGEERNFPAEAERLDARARDNLDEAILRLRELQQALVPSLP
jgi:hypothetical protein